jgi:vancomycin resistance protein YoaR
MLNIRKYNFSILTGFLTFLLFVSLFNGENNMSGIYKEVYGYLTMESLNSSISDIDEKESYLPEKFLIPVASGPTNTVPWYNNNDFKKKQEEEDTHVLMAAYSTVLSDPLPGEEYNVHLAASMLAGKVVEPGKVFSQNREIGPYTIGRGFKQGPTYMGTRLTKTIGGGVCKISSTLYNIAVLCNLEIVERYPHSMPVPYVPYGQDATVAYGARDFKLKNNTDFPVLIWAQGVDNILYIGFYGSEKPSSVEWCHKIIKEWEAPVIYRKNADLPIGTEKLLIEGMNGAVVKSWVMIEKKGGGYTVKNLGTSYYSSMPYIIEKG